MNKTHQNLLAEIIALHEKKAKDYAHSGDPYSNFKSAAETASGFTGVDAVFATLIGVKLARIRELAAPGRSPSNESLDDSFVDLTNYCAIWTSYRRDLRTPEMFEFYPSEGGGCMADPDPDPGDTSDAPHAYYPKQDGVCMICGSVGAH